MDKKPSDHNALTGNLTGIGPVPREIEHERMPALTWDTGRVPRHGLPADDVQAKRELTGEADMDRQEAILEAIPETNRSDPVPDSTGDQVPESPSEDEDDEGRSETEQLVDEGAEEAERDRMFQAARAAGKTARGQP